MLRGRVDLESLFLIIGVIKRAFNCFFQHQIEVLDKGILFMGEWRLKLLHKLVVIL